MGTSERSEKTGLYSLKGLKTMKLAKHTIFDSPLLNSALRRISLCILRSIGWKIEGKVPDISKYVLIAAPHTSNWDFVVTLLVAFGLELKVYTMIKQEMAEMYFVSSMFKWLGVIPVDRSQSSNTVEQAIQLFQENEKLVLVISPPGTRKKVRKWKTGFYHIANGADIPIAMGFLDYARKTGGIGPLFKPTGDIEADMVEIRSFYLDITGKYSDHAPQHTQVGLTLI